MHCPSPAARALPPLSAYGLNFKVAYYAKQWQVLTLAQVGQTFERVSDFHEEKWLIGQVDALEWEVSLFNRQCQAPFTGPQNVTCVLLKVFVHEKLEEGITQITSEIL